jgi:hypothetical protein
MIELNRLHLSKAAKEYISDLEQEVKELREWRARATCSNPPVTKVWTDLHNGEQKYLEEDSRVAFKLGDRPYLQFNYTEHRDMVRVSSYFGSIVVMPSASNVVMIGTK